MKRNNKIQIFLVLLLISSSISGKEITRNVTDMAGRKVSIPTTINGVFTDRFTSLLVFATTPKLLLNATFSVNQESKRYISSDYYKDKPLTEDQDEEIIKLHPDIIIIGNLKGQSTIDNANKIQERLKIPVLVVNFTIEDYTKSFAFLGDVLGREAYTKQLIGFIDKYLTPISTKAKTISAVSKPKIYYAEGPTGLNTEPAGSIHSQVIDYLAGKNVAKASTGDVHGMAKVSMEQILVWKPDIILVWTGYPSGMGLPGIPSATQSTYEHIMTNPIWKKTNAVKNKNVYQIPALPFGWFDRPPSSNCLLGAIWLAEKLYPSLITYNINNAIKEYFQLFYHITITDKDVFYLSR